MTYESTARYESAVLPGVSFQVVRMSFGRRLALVRELRAITTKSEYHRAGGGGDDAVEAALLEAEADRICLRWGLAGVAGLEIDGTPATADALFAAGPEEFCREVVQRIRQECFLTDEQQKN
ncbi:MAG TPA: hypothetical protein VFL57_02650 [Bryobacteraceae bacterium]|nr:hypothetical protein [Bryobacteraceae bacterium]